jgi:hypothetical protein
MLDHDDHDQKSCYRKSNVAEEGNRYINSTHRMIADSLLLRVRLVLSHIAGSGAEY